MTSLSKNEKLQKIISENEIFTELYIKSLVKIYHQDFNYLYSKIMLLRVIDMKLKELLFRVKDEDLCDLAYIIYIDVVNTVTGNHRNRIFYDLPHCPKATDFYRISEPILQEVFEGVEMIKELKRMEKEQEI